MIVGILLLERVAFTFLRGVLDVLAAIGLLRSFFRFLLFGAEVVVIVCIPVLLVGRGRMLVESVCSVLVDHWNHRTGAITDA